MIRQWSRKCSPFGSGYPVLGGALKEGSFCIAMLAAGRYNSWAWGKNRRSKFDQVRLAGILCRWVSGYEYFSSSFIKQQMGIW